MNSQQIGFKYKIECSEKLFYLFIFPGLLLFSCGTPDKNESIDKRPNILLLVADDLGYADLGCYGGDIETPNIDKLAHQGIKFSRFHTSPFCAPTRAMLLSGNDNHLAGMGRQGRTTNEFGYEGKLTDRVATIPQLLQKEGYHTYMVGKWHLGMEPSSNPHQKGFEHSFALLPGAGNHYDDQGIFKADPISPYTEDGQIAHWEKDAYSTDFYTDKLIEYIDRYKADKKPFFGFAAYTSPHWPLQVDEKYWTKYKGRYDGGYEKLKESRLNSLIQAGFIPKDSDLPPNHERVMPWDSLTSHEQKIESRKMELYAGMVDNLDFNIGRIIKHLKDIGEYENTLIIFMSDNGAAAEDFYYHDLFGPFIREHFNDNYEHMGKPNSFVSYGPQWAEAGSAPFKFYKGFTTEGGMIAPMIISGYRIKRSEKIEHEFLTLMDIAPTFYHLAQVDYPKTFNDKNIMPLKGNSILPYLDEEIDHIHDSDYVFGLEHGELAMIRKGDWKITNTEKPFSLANFKLYNVKEDLAELHDLREMEKEKYKELIDEWVNFSNEIKAQFPSPESNNQIE